jgi:hypothetical protein
MMLTADQQREKQIYRDFLTTNTKPVPPPTGLRKFQDLTGIAFHKLVVIGHVEGAGSMFDGLRWRLRCLCGSKRVIEAYSTGLISGQVTDCGCAKGWASRKRKQRRRAARKVQSVSQTQRDIKSSKTPRKTTISLLP